MKTIDDHYIPGIGVCAGLLMLKWDLLNEQMALHPVKIDPGEDVNVFINFESVLRNLANQKNLPTKVSMFKQEIVIELESAILNLVANYRSYYKKNNCNARVFLYYTDLKSESEQQMCVYNKHYREYYKNRYLTNAQFKALGELLTSIVIPEIQLILKYVPGCYFVSSETFDSSLIPKIISSKMNGKNVIISGDIFDTLYMFDPTFITIYIKRRFQYMTVTTNIESTVRSIIKDEFPFDLNIFNAELYYRLLLSIKGSKIRNIKSAKGFGYTKYVKILNDGLKNGVVLRDFSSIISVIELFPYQFREDINDSFKCMSLDTQLELISDTDVSQVMNQIIDKVDIKSIEELNNKRFFNNPINLPALIY